MIQPPRAVAAPSVLRRFLDSEAAGGLVLMASAAAALAIANSPLAALYMQAVHAPVGRLSVTEWVNDGLMTLFFLLVALEIKREILHGRLRRWSDRILPGLGALGGMVLPALIFMLVNQGQASSKGWAIPAATDIAFALAVIAVLGRAVPASLKVFLTALAVLDDLGAVLIIAIFYTGVLHLPMLAAAAIAWGALWALNRAGVRRLAPYLGLGAVLWGLVFASGLHATLAGVLLAAAVPAEGGAHSPLHRLEGALAPWVAFLVLPVFGFVNAGVSLAGAGVGSLGQPVTLGTALGLVFGKQLGVFGAVWLAAALGLARRPAGAGWWQVYGISVLCGIGFTMSLFIGLLAFGHAADLQNEVKIGVLTGSLVSAAAGALVLRFAPRIESPKAVL